MTKILKYLSVLALVLIGLTACSSKEGHQTSDVNHKEPVVTVTTSFLDDMVKQLAGDYVKRDLIIPAGEDPHLYVAKSSDLKKLQEADLVLYHGLHFEGKMVDALEAKGTAVTKGFSKKDVGTMDEDGEKVVDPHFWFDIDLYKKAVKEASKELKELVPEHRSDIAKNTKEYLAELDDLDQWNKKALSVIPKESRYLVTPHDAFNYFARRYDFTLYAPQGVSTDSEVANSDMMETVNLINEHKIKAIFTESTTNPERMKKLQEAVAAKGGNVAVVTGEGKELFSDSLAPEGQDGDSYIDMYKHNTNLIVEALK
ncbi:metal ABC transporter solute-binding protein, Zn/Mn family [Streptococcus pluranimalium]|uniref:metal ABC transporter solute-binding protein, Zn/Mn family n=1 Tax=Streptococcus pluranimalium TaxID=82348 RepID=UPI002414FC98|nr:zinc ABC transporter substrate-binding protein [Streptococcus pluranimalium]WFM79427.1 zinc ABC transporter substrate-binding protein [Streptococcus pluranimalium]